MRMTCILFAAVYFTTIFGCVELAVLIEKVEHKIRKKLKRRRNEA